MKHSTIYAPQKNSLRFWYIIILCTIFIHIIAIIFIFFKTIINQEITAQDVQKMQEPTTIFFIPHAAPSSQTSPNINDPVSPMDTDNSSPQEPETPSTQTLEQPAPETITHDDSLLQHIIHDLTPIPNDHEQKQIKPIPSPEKTIEQKKLPSLSDLLQGFMQKKSTPTPQTQGILKSGTEQAAITRKQLLLEQYLSKMGKTIEVSFSSMRSERPDKRMNRPITLSLIIQPSGRLESITVKQSSGLADMDQFFIRVFQDAGFSFPPVPELLLYNGLYYFTVTIDPPDTPYSYGQISIGTLRW